MAMVLKVEIMKRILTVLILSATSLLLRAQSQMLHERLYLSTDKECYIAGEPMWISAFCYDAVSGKPSPVSAVAYIELQNLSGSVVQAKIALTDGRGSGLIDLPVSLPTGNYRLIAYTRYMYSESEHNVFKRIITIYNPLTSLRSDNVKVASGAEPTRFPETQPESTRELNVLTNSKVYQSGEQVRITLSHSLPGGVSLSVSVFRKDNLNHFCNPSISAFVDSTRNQSFTPFPLWRVDYPGEVIRGHVVDENNNPVASSRGFGSYISIAGNQIQYFTGELMDNGSVRFFTSNLYGDGTLISYIPSLNDRKYHLVLDSVYMNPRVNELPELILDITQQHVLEERSLSVQLSQAFGLDTLFREEKTETNLLFENSGIVYKLDEYTRFPTMGEVIVEFIREARFRTVGGSRVLQLRLRDAGGTVYYVDDPTPPLVLLDGIPVRDHEKIYAYDPALVREIIVYPDKYAFGPIYYNGILFLKTYRGDFPDMKLEESMRIHEFQGVQNSHSFGTVPGDSRLPDLRHTLYWNPRVDLKDTDPVTFRTTASQTKGTFVVVAEGMNREGKSFRNSTEFTVK
jgi:hypothetical protein